MITAVKGILILLAIFRVNLFNEFAEEGTLMTSTMVDGGFLLVVIVFG